MSELADLYPALAEAAKAEERWISQLVNEIMAMDDVAPHLVAEHKNLERVSSMRFDFTPDVPATIKRAAEAIRQEFVKGGDWTHFAVAEVLDTMDLGGYWGRADVEEDYSFNVYFGRRRDDQTLVEN